MQRRYLHIILAATEDGRYLAESAEASIASSRACGVETCLTVAAPASVESTVREALAAWPEIRILWPGSITAVQRPRTVK